MSRLADCHLSLIFWICIVKLILCANHPTIKSLLWQLAQYTQIEQELHLSFRNWPLISSHLISILWESVGFIPDQVYPIDERLRGRVLSSVNLIANSSLELYCATKKWANWQIVTRSTHTIHLSVIDCSSWQLIPTVRWMTPAWCGLKSTHRCGQVEVRRGSGGLQCSSEIWKLDHMPRNRLQHTRMVSLKLGKQSITLTSYGSYAQREWAALWQTRG